MKTNVARFTMIKQNLYKRGYSMPLLKCLGPPKARQALDEVHEEDCGEHLRGRALAAKVLRAGFGLLFAMTLQRRYDHVTNANSMFL